MVYRVLVWMLSVNIVQQMGNQNEDHYLLTVENCRVSQMSNISYQISFWFEQSTRTQAEYTVGLGRVRCLLEDFSSIAFLSTIDSSQPFINVLPPTKVMWICCKNPQACL